MMVRSCKTCGGEKSGDQAIIDNPTYDKIEAFWKKLHLPGCRYVAMTEQERLDDFMENGSPVSSVDES